MKTIDASSHRQIGFQILIFLLKKFVCVGKVIITSCCCNGLNLIYATSENVHCSVLLNKLSVKPCFDL